MELLTWARGPALQIAVIVFVVGMLIRVLEIFILGRNKDLSKARGKSFTAGLRTIITRSVPVRGTWKQQLSGYIWHIGFILVLLFYAPHILLFKESLGLYWPALPTAVIDIVTIVTMAALVFSLFMRITDPVRRMLSTLEDYFVWLVTLLPVVTGYMAFHGVGTDYTLMLALHIMSVNLLLVVFPFTKLTHAVTVLFSRWYNGASAGRKGVRA
jgi:nitrate reductase gamma subunit